MGDPISLIVSPIVNTVIEHASSLIKEEFLLIKRVKKEVEKLSSTLTTIKGVLEDAEEKQLNDRQLKDWLGKLKDAAYDAEDVLDTFSTEAFLWKQKQQVRNFRPPFSKSKVSNSSVAAHKIKEILTRLDMIAQEREKFHLDWKVDDRKPETQDPRHTSFFVDRSGVVGREVDKDNIIDLLLPDDSDKDGEISVIPIIGMGGLGKTTLAQLVFSDEKIIDCFEFRMWVCVTVDFDLTKILKEMMESHSKMKQDFNISKSQLLSRLLDVLIGKRFLLVLDDVWTVDYQEWEQLQGLLKQGGKGSRVLVTSRTNKVSDIMGTKPPYRLSDLPDEECWSLFKKIAFKEDNLSSGARKDLEKTGMEIVRKCNGLPLAVKAMGGMLRGNVDVSKWREILRNDIWELEEDNSNTGMPKILPALKLSYDHLPPNLKQCFAYCSIFPKAYVFDKKELVKLWMAEAFLQPGGQNKAEEIGNKYFDGLFVRSFFQFSNVENNEKYRMHDLIHDLAQSISSPYCCQVRDNKPRNTSKKSRHVSLLCTDIEQPASEIVDQSNKLRTLLLPSGHVKNFGKALEKIFNTLRCIRVLDLSSSEISELPKSIEELKLLRYLDLSKTEIRMLPNSICNLYNLQTLKLLECLWLFELPMDLGNLINLRHLELDEMFWYKSSTLPPRMGNLTNLHNLHAFRVESGYGIDVMKDMAYLTGTLNISKLENVVNAGDAKLKEKESLHKVVLEWSDRDVDPQDESVLEDLQPHSNIKELQICHYRGSRFPPWMKDGVLQNLVSVSLSHCTKCKVLSLGQLPHLGKLYIKGMQDLEVWSEAQCPSLEMLDVLKISNCPKLRELPEFFPILRVLKIKKCDSLKALPVALLLGFLMLVDNLVLENWNEKERNYNIVNDQGQVVEQYHLRSFDDLLELKIISCPKLQAFPELRAPQTLEISGCQDETLVRAIPNTSSLCSLVISNISNLISLPKLPHLPGLKALYVRDCKDLESLFEEEEGSLRSLTSLKLLSIRNCPKLVTLPDEGLPTALECLTIGSCPNLKSLGSKETLKSLTYLKDLYIEDCLTLQSLPEEGLSTSLQHLHIQGCPLLTERCQEENGGGPDWQKIMHIPDLEIDSNKVRSFPDLAKPSATWLNHFRCCRGIEIREPGELQQQVNSHRLTQRDKGRNSKGKMILEAPSSST